MLARAAPTPRLAACYDDLAGMDAAGPWNGPPGRRAHPLAARTGFAVEGGDVVRRIEESVLIDAPRELVWRTFVDLTCWADWSSVLTRVAPEADASLASGSGFSCALRPFGLAISFAVRVEVAEAPARLRWVAARWGVRGRHWFHFSDHGDGTRCDSVEDLSGPAVALAGPLFPEWRFRDLTRRFLGDLKAGAERRAGG